MAEPALVVPWRLLDLARGRYLADSPERSRGTLQPSGDNGYVCHDVVLAADQCHSAAGFPSADQLRERPRAITSAGAM
jgi:hypothetical protein